MRDVYVIGAYTSQFKKWPDKSFKDLTREAYLGVLADAGLPDGREIEFAYFGNCAMGHWGQGMIRGQVCFQPLVKEGLFPERVPLINVEGACATGSMAFHGAWKDILSGQSELTLAMGVEKIFLPDDPVKTFSMFDEGIDNHDRSDLLRVYHAAAEKCGRPFETGPGRTIFMDTYAMQACYHMWRWGTTAEQIAVACSKNHYHGSLNPKAQYQFEVPVEKVMADRLISYPLTRSMCAPIGDGSAAALLCSADYLRNLPPAVQNRAVRVAASALTGGKLRSLDEPGLSHVAAQKAYRQAGVGPADIQVAEVHDATSFCEVFQVEMMGFCPMGQGGPFVGEGATKLDGQIPVNTSGGLVSKGHPIGATGLSMIYELCQQLRGEAGPRQVQGAAWALQENGGGVIGFEEAACSVIILNKDR
ncbi:MAG: thiolase family protein [Deltaproteobacteria bacterium]|nr:thiolase family protein [Deltaproteobacteria bacterium]